MAWGCHDVVMRAVLARLGAGVAAIGLLALVSGTFLPWLRSGSVLRDSYQSIGALRVLLSSHTGIVAMLDGWLAMIPVCSVCVALYALRLRRLSAWIVCVISACAGTVCGFLAVQGGDPGSIVGVATIGPAVSTAGAALSLLGAIVVLIGLGGRRASTPGGTS